ncbi:hypothetical protein M2341_000979 [Sphingobium sp. B7D2B]|uniref:hypothetical protein n=1 Tax=Sphingobium sp. B7D2B TaxID=2940583 RepID=UPI002224DCCB|nr:hypothetical protein [Sphingobium sp. B7D2B]MCW2365532.1 hypothetical protein [Sphingobium sp. B7D2B]
MTTLFIEADELLMMFSSIEMAEEHLEAIDVRNGARAFGQAGELFAIETQGERVIIRAIEQPAEPDRLYELLRRSLQQVGEVVPLDADLPTLVAATQAFWTKRQRLVSAKLRLGCVAVVILLAVSAALIWA